MPEYVYLGYQPDDGYVGKSYYAEETPEIGIDTRYALCPEGSFVVPREVLEGMIKKLPKPRRIISQAGIGIQPSHKRHIKDWRE